MTEPWKGPSHPNLSSQAPGVPRVIKFLTHPTCQSPKRMNVNKNDALQGHIHLCLPRFHPNSSPHNVCYPRTSISSTPFEEEGYCLTGISAFWLQANQFGCPVVSFLLGAGENDTG